MKLIINKGCFNTTIRLSDKDKDIPLSIEAKKYLLNKILDKIIDEDILTTMIQDYSYYLKPIHSEYDTCGQCGDYNQYEEFEI